MKKTLLFKLLLTNTIALFMGIGLVNGQVIISQYYEGTSNNKYIEITNVGTSAVDLSTYHLGRWSGTDAPSGTYSNGAPLTGSISAGETQVYMNASSVDPAYAVALATGSTTATYFNGDDPVALTNGGSDWSNVVDCIYGSLTSGNWGTDKGFYRKATVLAGNTGISTLDGSGEWIEITIDDANNAASDESEYIGFHIYNGAPDTDPPAATFEEDGETDILPYENLTITMDEAILKIDGNEVTDGDLSTLVVLRETDASGTIIPFSATIDANKKIITVNPTSDLTNGQLYYIALNPVEDGSGNESILQTGSFTVVGALVPYIDITAPLGGEQFFAGEEITVTWNHANIVGGVDVLAYVPESDTWEVMIDNTPCDGTEAFIIPIDAQYSDLYKIRVQDDATGLVVDSSDVITVVSIPTIYEIQSNTSDGDLSVYDGHIVKTSGIITFSAWGEYVIQDGDGSWNGIYVYDTNFDETSVEGDSVTIVAEVGKYNGVTQLTNVESLTINNSGNALPAISTITTAELTEEYEGVLVKIINAEVVSDPVSGHFEINDGSGVLVVDDNLYSSAENGITTGMYLTITGVGYSNNGFQLLPRYASDMLFADATVSSTVYTIDNGLETITDIALSEPLATFEGNITGNNSATFETYESNGTTVAADLATGYKVIATAEDGVTQKTYVITLNAASTDATLSDLRIDGGFVSGFDAGTFDYEKELDAGTTVTPTVTATPTFEYADVDIDPATDVTSDTEADRTTTITVTAEDGVTELVYTVLFNVASTGINDLTTGFKIYPNPSTGLFTLEMNNASNGKYSVEVYDVIGKLIYKSKVTESITNINLTHMNAGLYYVSVNNGDVRNITKIMIQ